MNRAADFDAVIVGSGAAGLHCAAIAGQLGARVLLLDHAAKVAEKIFRAQTDLPINTDDRLADDVFQAALELCAETGTYCTDTSRVIRFTKEELLEALRDAPSAPVFGEGTDRKPMVSRRPDSAAPPWCFVKTQFGPVEGHVALVELLAALQREFFPDLEVSDEGGYWETRDLAALRRKMEYVQSAIDGRADGLRRHGLTSEAAEDPGILAARITRVAQLVQRTLCAIRTYV